MAHKIIIEIESEVEWNAICSLSSLLEIPISKIAKDDVLSMTRMTAQRAIEDESLMKALDRINPENKKRLLAVIKE